jgi:hypothetical protein
MARQGMYNMLDTPTTLRGGGGGGGGGGVNECGDIVPKNFPLTQKLLS